MCDEGKYHMYSTKQRENVVNRIEENQSVINSTGKGIQLTNRMLAINLGEMRSLLEVIQSDEISEVDALAKANGVKAKEHFYTMQIVQYY